MKVGVIGLPNVGKSSLFSLLTKNSQIHIANYPFATIEPSVGNVAMVDKRISQLAAVFGSAKTVPPLLKFWDIAGLVKGAHEGAGLGNAFLHHVQEAEALIHVVRAFSDTNIHHVDGRVDPLSDWETIRLELLFRDRETLKKLYAKLDKNRLSVVKSAHAAKWAPIVEKVLAKLEKDLTFDDTAWTSMEKEYFLEIGLLSIKPQIVLLNVSPETWTTIVTEPRVASLIVKLDAEKIPWTRLAVNFELLISGEPATDQTALRAEYQIPDDAVHNVIAIGYKLLKMATFFSVGPKETHGWSFVTGMTARQCAGLIHSDIERGYIRGEIGKADDLIRLGSWSAAKDLGLIRSEGADYLMADGDVCNFHFSV